MPDHPIPDGTYGGGTFTNCTITMTAEELAQLRLQRQQRLNAVGVIIGASELVGAHGLHLTRREVDEMPEKVRQALHTLGVADAELHAADTGEGDDA